MNRQCECGKPLHWSYRQDWLTLIGHWTARCRHGEWTLCYSVRDKESVARFYEEEHALWERLAPRLTRIVAAGRENK